MTKNFDIIKNLENLRDFLGKARLGESIEIRIHDLLVHITCARSEIIQLRKRNKLYKFSAAVMAHMLQNSEVYKNASPKEKQLVDDYAMLYPQAVADVKKRDMHAN